MTTFHTGPDTGEHGMLTVSPNATETERQRWRHSPPRVHPLVWTHKDGRKSLLLGNTCAQVEDMDYLEGQALLCKLRDWATRPGNVYSHTWSVGDRIRVYRTRSGGGFPVAA